MASLPAAAAAVKFVESWEFSILYKTLYNTLFMGTAIPDICHFLYATAFLACKLRARKVRKFAK